MGSYQAYDLTSALEDAVTCARRSGETRFVVQTCYGYQIRKELGPALYDAWQVNADGSVDDARERETEDLTETLIPLNSRPERGISNGL
jgi:hypothetical protein